MARKNSTTARISEGKMAIPEIVRLRAENQTAWNKLEFAEESNRRLRAALERIINLQEKGGIGKAQIIARKALANGE
jgi:hypothetical protein